MVVSSLVIPGLRYQSGYVGEVEQAQLVAAIEQQPWITDLKRRVQHYGYRYDYTRHKVDRAMYLGPLPAWLAPLAQRLLDDDIFAALPDQVIVNEYEPGQGISAHIDCVPCFGDTIVSLSLLSSCVMLFTRAEPVAQMPVLLEPCSLLVMQGEARYHWQHAIPARKVDDVAGARIPRGRRISLTFRTMLTGMGQEDDNE
jgi:alkylated DNA repair dioxygenase AlkB